MDYYDETVREIRRFNRFFTVNMGLLNSDYLDTEYSIAETRILFEIRMCGTCIQSDIAKMLHMDKSYLSRLINRFHRNGLVQKTQDDDDRRAIKIMLTEKGNAETQRLIALTDSHIKAQITDLAAGECDELCRALNTVIAILGKGGQSI